MADYFAVGNQVVTNTTADTTISVETGGDRFRVYDFTSGFDLASPSDGLFVIAADRFGTTDDGLGTAEVPAPLDQSEIVFAGNCIVDHTTEPNAYLADSTLWTIAQHMRATYRWVAAPGKELVMPTTANTGIGFFAIHASLVPVHNLGLYFSV